MRTIVAMCISALVACTLFIFNALRWPNEYGAFVGAPQTEVAVLVEKPTEFLDKTVTVLGTVKRQCKTMGCFFYFSEGEKTLRVNLEEIAMKAPRREGHSARVEGRMVPYGDGYQLFASAVKFE